MATIGLDSGTAYADSVGGLQGSILRRSLFPAVRWGAILAGVAVGISVQMVLTLLGIATGLTMTEFNAGETVGRGPLLWAGFSILASAFVGGYVSARMSGLKRKIDGILHGAVSWAVTILIFLVLATSAGGLLLSGMFNTVASGGGSTLNGMGGNLAFGSLFSNQTGGTTIDSATMRRIQQLIQSGQREEAIVAVMGAMSIDRGRAGAIVDQALILSGSQEKASPQAKATIDAAKRSVGNAAWAAFITLALSMALSIIGGMVGAVTSQRRTWMDGSLSKTRVDVKTAADKT